jgi:cytochrome o ubiquinol oxidase subunit II
VAIWHIKVATPSKAREQRESSKCRHTVLRLSPMLMASSAMTGCKEGILDPRGPIGVQEKLLLYDATVIMLSVVIPVIALTIGFAWWFRDGNHRARYRPDWEYSGQIELIVWTIPALIVFFLGGIAWISSHELDPPRPIASREAPLDVDVVSLDWRWLFIYPAAGIASLNELVIPSGTAVRFHLTAASVMNSFFIPQLGSQIYTMPDMVTNLNLLAKDTGVFAGLSAQFSGEGFSDMRFTVRVVRTDEFTRWVGGLRRESTTLDEATLLELAHPQIAGPPVRYARVEPALFDHISSGHLTSQLSRVQER